MSPKISPLLTRLFFILIFITATSAAYLLLPDYKTKTENTPTTQLVTTTAQQLAKPVVIKQTDIEAVAPPINQTTTMVATEIVTEKFQTTTLLINNESYNLQFKTGENLLSAMQRLETSSVKPFTFSGRDYPSLGFFVEEINNIKNDPGKQLYWFYYVNGQSGNLGVSNYNLQPEDIIKWQYEKSNF